MTDTEDKLDDLLETRKNARKKEQEFTKHVGDKLKDTRITPVKIEQGSGMKEFSVIMHGFLYRKDIKELEETFPNFTVGAIMSGEDETLKASMKHEEEQDE